jgi:hypothetical protein
VLWGKRERIEALELPRVASAPDTAPDRIETGTLSFEAIAGATAAVEFLAGLAPGRDEVRRGPTGGSAWPRLPNALHASGEPSSDGSGTG